MKNCLDKKLFSKSWYKAQQIIIWKFLTDLNKKHYNNCYWKVYRVNSISCPIDVNMYEYYKALGSKNFRKTLSKYQLRNQEFSVKEVSKD